MTALARLRRVLDDRRFELCLLALLFVLAMVFLAQTYHRAQRPMRYDFAGYLEASKALQSGGDPYHTPGRFPFIYPLFLAVVLLPLANVPYEAAVGLWFAISAACAVLVARIVARLGAPASTPTGAASMGLLTLLGFLDPVQIDLLNGQANLEVLLLSLLFVERHLAGRKDAAAAFLGAAIAVKIVPAIFLLYLAARREGRAIAIAMTVATALSLSPALLVGSAVFGHYATYVREFVLGHAQSAWLTGWRIWFTPYGFVGYLVPSLEGSLIVRYATVAAALGALGALTFVTAARAAQVWLLGLFQIAIPMLLPMSEVHHLVWVMPAAALLSLAALHPAEERPVVRYAAVLFWALLWIGRLHREGPYYFLALCAVTVGVAALARVGAREASWT